jgi:hypothetical protein
MIFVQVCVMVLLYQLLANQTGNVHTPKQHRRGPHNEQGLPGGRPVGSPELVEEHHRRVSKMENRAEDREVAGRTWEEEHGPSVHKDHCVMEEERRLSLEDPKSLAEQSYRSSAMAE